MAGLWDIIKVTVGSIAIIEGLNAISKSQQKNQQNIRLSGIRKPCNCPQDQLRFKKR